MQDLKVNGIVLRIDPYRTSTSIVTFLSKNQGILRGFFRLTKNQPYKRSLAFGSLLALEVHENDLKKDVLSILSFEIEQDLLSLGKEKPSWFVKWLYCELWAEILSKTSIEPASSPFWFQTTLELFSNHFEPDSFSPAQFLRILNLYLAEIGYPFSWEACQICRAPSFKWSTGKLKLREIDHFLSVEHHGLICRKCGQSTGFGEKKIVGLPMIKLWAKLQDEQPIFQLAPETLINYLELISLIFEGFFRVRLQTYQFFKKDGAKLVV